MPLTPLERLNARLDACKTRCKQLAATVDNVLAANNLTVSMNQELHAEIDTLHQQIAALDEQVATLTAQLAAAQSPPPPTGSGQQPPPVTGEKPPTQPAPPTTVKTNCELGTGAFGGYNVKSGPDRFIVGEAIAFVERAVSMENSETVDTLSISDFVSSSTNYGGYGSPRVLNVNEWNLTTNGGPDDYGYRGVVQQVNVKGWQITTKGKNKAALRLTGTIGASIAGLKVKGGHVWLGGGAADGENPQGFSNATIEIEQEFEAGNPNQSAMQLFKGSNVTITGTWTLPPGKKLMTCWTGASCSMGGFVNGVKLTEANKAQYIDGVPGAANVTII